MVTEDLLKYVEYQINRGLDRNSIKMTLLQNGWTGEDINEAFKIVETVSTTIPTAYNSAGNTNPTAGINEASDQNSSNNAFTQTESTAQPQTARNTLNPTAENFQAQAVTSNFPTQSQPVAFRDPSLNTEQSVATSQNYTSNPSAQLATFSTTPGQIQNTAVSDLDNQRLATAMQPNGLVINPQESATSGPVNDLKYRSASDWQQNNTPNVAPSNVTSNPVTSNQPATATSPNVAGMPQSTTAGPAVYRPQINPNLAQVNPAVALRKQKQQEKLQRRQSSKLRNILITLIVLILLGGGGFYVYSTYLASPQYDLGQVITAMQAQDYILYDINGVLPIDTDAISESGPVAISQITSDTLPIKVQGLIDPTSARNGFGVSFNQATFDFVYDGIGSFAKIRQLPESLSSQYSDVIGQWFDFSTPSQTRSTLGFFSSNPPASLPDLGSDLAAALQAVYSEGLLQINDSGGGNVEGQAVDTLTLSFDPRQVSSRLSEDSAMISDLLSVGNVTQVSVTLSIEKSSMLPLRADVELITDGSSQQLTIEFSYDYDGNPITAPLDPLPAETVITPLLSLSEISVAANVNSQLSVFGSRASVWMQENDTFIGLCTSEELAPLRDYVDQTFEGAVVCNETADNFAVQATLPEPGFFACIDQNYAARTTAASIGTGTICPEATQYRPAAQSPVINPTQQTDSAITDEEFFE